ncbi:MAG TPA: hypothetical protein VL974_11660 [Magnetospirillum sp.]|jgi:hypothetical protein|nr:hypothetical protein [Magnetospirillum sp.]
MSRIHDALENARALIPADGRAIAEPPRLPGGVAASDLPLLRLWQAVEVRLAGKASRVIQIVPCGEDEHDPAVAVRLARLAGRSLGGGVLLLNQVESETRMDDGGEVALGPLPGRAGDPRALNSRLLGAYWQALADKAELIILDTPPVLSSPLSQALAPTVDGVILVVEADRTCTAHALEAKQALQGGGANILGVVLNKRRNYVPKALDRRL